MQHSRWEGDAGGWSAAGRGPPGGMGSPRPETWQDEEMEEEEIVEEHHDLHHESDPDDLYGDPEPPHSDVGNWQRPQSASPEPRPVPPPGSAGSSPPRRPSDPNPHHPAPTPGRDARVRFDRFARSPRPQFRSIQHSSAAAPPSPQSPSEVPRVVRNTMATRAMPVPELTRPAGNDPPPGAWRAWAVEAARLPKSALPGAPPPPPLAVAAAEMRARRQAGLGAPANTVSLCATTVPDFRLVTVGDNADKVCACCFVAIRTTTSACPARRIQPVVRKSTNSSNPSRRLGVSHSHDGCRWWMGTWWRWGR
jgi:hypothetical protein